MIQQNVARTTIPDRRQQITIIIGINNNVIIHDGKPRTTYQLLVATYTTRREQNYNFPQRDELGNLQRKVVVT